MAVISNPPGRAADFCGTVIDRLAGTFEGDSAGTPPYDPAMTIPDLSFLAQDLQRAARCDPNGEVSWPISLASIAIEALADSGRLILGLDIRDYSSDGTFMEVPWSSYAGSDVEEARAFALSVLSHGDLPGDWVLITW